MSSFGKGSAGQGQPRSVGRHMADHPHHWLAALVVVVIVLAAAVALAVVRDNSSGNRATAGGPRGAAGASSGSTSPSGASSPSGSATSSAGADAVPAGDATQAALARCRSDWRSESAPLSAAARSLGQWRVHVGAMNQLVAGQISLAQAQAFWSATRVAAAGRAARFQESLRAFRHAVEGCPGTSIAGLATGHPAATAQLRSCAEGVRARRHALAAAATAVATWKHHIADMEMLRMGQMTPAQATAMWLASWRLGVAQLDAYHHARAEARTAPGC